MSEPYRFGIEEEYFLADAATGGTPDAAVLEHFHARAKSGVPRVERELLATQVEGSTPPLSDFREARRVLSDIRAGLAATARDEGLLVLASGTHPLASWTRQSPSEGERYRTIAAELRLPGRRNMVSGLHVHVEVARPDARVELMNRLLPFLPLLLALSASSPFWQCMPTGLAAYRLCVFGEMPRTGLPEVFASGADYERFLEVMTRAGAIPDPSYVWWVVRPSLRYPTLELRIADSCTRLDDTIAIAALWRCLVRLAERRPELNRGVDGVERGVAAENLWRAQRDGVRAELIDARAGTVAPVGERLDQLLALVAEDADALGCRAEAWDARRIVAGGTSADRQMALFEAARGDGATEPEAVRAAVGWVAAVTRGEGG